MRGQGVDHDPEVQRNLAHQAELYGEPLGPLVRGLCDHFGLTQARMAEALGLSAPMLSQLMTGRRVKIGNPAVVSRLQHLIGLARSGRPLDQQALDAELQQVRTSQTTLTGVRTVPDTSTLLGGLRAMATPEQLRACAQAVGPISPELAELMARAADGRQRGGARRG